MGRASSPSIADIVEAARDAAQWRSMKKHALTLQERKQNDMAYISRDYTFRAKFIETSKNIAVIFACMSVAALAADFIGFCLWIYSEQVPVDSFFIGGITKWILGAIFF